MAVYHWSVIDFFIPYAPRGEGGFLSERTTCAAFLNLFVGQVFGGHALRINALNAKSNTHGNQVCMLPTLVGIRAVVDVEYKRSEEA
jgi:hypothetical protein